MDTRLQTALDALEYISTNGRNERILTRDARSCSNPFHFMNPAERPVYEWGYGNKCLSCHSEWWATDFSEPEYSGDYWLQAVAAKAIEDINEDDG